MWTTLSVWRAHSQGENRPSYETLEGGVQIYSRSLLAFNLDTKPLHGEDILLRTLCCPAALCPIYYVFNELKIYRHRYLSWSVKIIQTLSFERSASVAPEVNLRILLCPNNEAHTWGVPLWLWNPGQTSPKVHNRGISGPTERTDVLQKILPKNKKQKSFSFKLINLTP